MNTGATVQMLLTVSSTLLRQAREALATENTRARIPQRHVQTLKTQAPTGSTKRMALQSKILTPTRSYLSTSSIFWQKLLHSRCLSKRPPRVGDIMHDSSEEYLSSLCSQQQASQLSLCCLGVGLLETFGSCPQVAAGYVRTGEAAYAP